MVSCLMYLCIRALFCVYNNDDSHNLKSHESIHLQLDFLLLMLHEMTLKCCFEK